MPLPQVPSLLAQFTRPDGTLDQAGLFAAQMAQNARYNPEGDPSLGANVDFGYSGLKDQYGNTSRHFTPEELAQNGGAPHFFFTDTNPGSVWATTDQQEIADRRDDARTRMQQGAVKIGALIGGGTALANALGSAAAAGGGAAGGSGAATTFPYAAGGTVTGSAIPGVTAGTAGGATAAAAPSGGAIAPTASKGGGGIFSKLGKSFKDPSSWLGMFGGGGESPVLLSYTPHRQSFAGFDPNPTQPLLGSPMAKSKDQQRKSKLIEMLMRDA